MKADAGPQGPAGSTGATGMSGCQRVTKSNVCFSTLNTLTGVGALVACPTGKTAISGGYEIVSGAKPVYLKRNQHITSNNVSNWELSPSCIQGAGQCANLCFDAEALCCYVQP